MKWETAKQEHDEEIAHYREFEALQVVKDYKEDYIKENGAEFHRKRWNIQLNSILLKLAKENTNEELGELFSRTESAIERQVGKLLLQMWRDGELFTEEKV
tara:strand:+ start:547 stop:849 length:303 start_codon:yes stop_codon:yes gene_type:complete